MKPGEKKSGWILRIKLPGSTIWKDAIDYRTKKVYFFTDWGDAVAMKESFEKKGCAAELEQRAAEPEAPLAPSATAQKKLF